MSRGQTGRRWARPFGVATVGVAATGTLVSTAEVAAAYPAQPPTDASYYYMGSTSTTLADDLGCAQATQDTSTGRDSRTVLDFGGQLADGSGTLAIGNQFDFTNRDIKNVAVAYAQGYASCFHGGATQNYVALTTNNSYQDISTSGGKAWGNVVTFAEDDIVGDGFGGHVTATGGTDMEPGFGAEGASLDWIAGYDSTASEYLVDTGSADGCPQNASANDLCANGWTQTGVYKAATGYDGKRSFGVVDPEVYYAPQALQWQQLASYSVSHPLSNDGPLEPDGVTEEHPRAPGTDSAAQAWSQLGAALDQVRVGAGTASAELTYLLEVQQAGPSAAARTKPATQTTGSPVVTNPPANPAVGIRRGNQGPFPSETFRNTSAATVQTPEGYVTVFAGETGAASPAGGARAAVMQYDDPADVNDGQPPSLVGTYPLPCAGPAATVTAIQGSEVVVTCSSGQVETFNPLTQVVTPAP